MVACLTVGIELQRSGSGKQAEETFSKTVIRYGDTGKDVVELQGRLKFLGYYKSDVDGVFGYNTLKSLKWFQSSFGMDVDGVLGDKTKLKLWQATQSWRPTEADVPKANRASGGGGGADAAPSSMTSSNRLGLSEQDLNVMANAVYGEARGEPYEGQVAVAAVILNRVNSSQFPNTVHGVIFFSRGHLPRLRTDKSG